MRRIVFALLLGALSICLMSCATPNNYSLVVNSWQGANINALMRSWGYPGHIRRMSNGNYQYTYYDVQHGRNPRFVKLGYTRVTTDDGKTVVDRAPTAVSAEGSYRWDCETWFIVSPKSTILSVHSRGNGCSFNLSQRKQFVNKLPRS